MEPNWGLTGEGLIEQQADWPEQDSDAEEAEPQEGDGSDEPGDSGFYCDTSDYWG